MMRPRFRHIYSLLLLILLTCITGACSKNQIEPEQLTLLLSAEDIFVDTTRTDFKDLNTTIHKWITSNPKQTAKSALIKIEYPKLTCSVMIPVMNVLCEFDYFDLTIQLYDRPPVRIRLLEMKSDTKPEVPEHKYCMVLMNSHGELMVDFQPITLVRFETYLKERLLNIEGLFVDLIVDEGLTAEKLYPVLGIIDKLDVENFNLRFVDD